MRVVFMGTPDFSVPTLQMLIDSRHDVVGVFTQPDRPKGRGGKVQMSPVKELALKHDIPVFQPVKMRLDGLEPLRELKPDICVTAAFGQILSQDVLDVPPMGTVNVHASLLPRHRGAAPIQWSILSGDQVAGVTTMFSDRGIDTGDMLLKAETPISEDDTAGTLTDRIAQMGAELLIETLDQLERGICPREKQDESQMTYDPKIDKEMGRITFEEGVQKTLLRVRAMSPWPCAFAELSEGVLKIWRAKKSDIPCNAPAGTVLRANKKDGLVVADCDGAIELCEIQAPNAKRMDARAFLLGHPIEEGKLLKEVRV